MQFLLFLLTFTTLFTTLTALTYPIPHNQLYLSPYNWDITQNAIQTTNPGAYVRLVVNGTTTLSFNVDLTNTPTSDYMMVKYTITQMTGEENMGYITFPSDINKNVMNIPFKFDPTISYTVNIYLRSSIQTLDRWLKPVNHLTFVSFTIDDNANLLPVPVAPHTTLIYWDSIGEGVNVLDHNGNDLVDNDSTLTWTYVLAKQLSSEVGVVAYGRQGYSISGNGNVAPLFNISDIYGLSSAWEKYFASESRLSPYHILDQHQPTYIFCGHGTNDKSTPESTVYPLALNFTYAIRSASPNSLFFLTIPFGQFHFQTLTDVYNTYYNATGDARTILLDLGSEVAVGLDGKGAMPGYSFDGIHPVAARSQEIGYLFAAAVQKYINLESNQNHIASM